MSGSSNPAADLAWLTARGKEFLACDEKLAEYAKLLREKVTGDAIPSLQWKDSIDGFPFDLVGRSFKLAHRYNPELGVTYVQVLEMVPGRKDDEWIERSALTMDRSGNLQPTDASGRVWPWSIHNDGVALFYKCLVEAVKAT